MPHPQMIENARDDKIHQILHRLGMMIETRIGGEDKRTAARKLQHVFQMYRGKRHLTRYQDEFAVFLQHDIGRAFDQFLA